MKYPSRDTAAPQNEHAALLPPVERSAFGSTLSKEEVAVKLRNAPEWVLRAIAGPPAAPAKAKRRPSLSAAAALAAKAELERVAGVARRSTARPPAPAAARRYSGWVAGLVCPGRSVPAYSSRDGETLPEEFSVTAVAAFVEQWRSGEPIPILWKHDGPRLAESPLDVTLRAHGMLGLAFEARLPACDLGRLVLEQLAARGCGVSIAYESSRAEQEIIERPGVGRVRQIQRARLVHVALLPPSGQSPAYRGGRAFGSSDGRRLTCPPLVKNRAELFAWDVVRMQTGRLWGEK